MATSAVIGTGCNSSTGLLSLAADNDPWTGRNWSLTGSGFPAGSLGFAAVGLGTQSLLISSLHPAGGPGCVALVTLDAVQLVLPAAGQAAISFGLPVDPAFAGITLNAQQYCLELGGGGQITLISSTNAIAGTLGAL